VGPYGRSAPRERPGPEEERLGALPASGGSPPVVCRGGVRARRLSPCVEAPGAESGWSVVRGVDVGRRRRSPFGVRVWAAWWPESFPAVPCRSLVRPRDRLETQASQLGSLDIGFHASRVVRRDVVQARCRRSGDNSPGSLNLVDHAPRRKTIRPVAVVDRVVPPTTRRAARPGRISCSNKLCPAVPPAEQDMREVVLPAVRSAAEPGGSASCPQRRVSRACCPQIPALGPMGLRFLLRFELGHRASGGSRGRVGAWVGVRRRRGCGCATGPTGCFMRYGCGSCRPRRTGRSRSVGSGCRWCRCSTSRPVAVARPAWPRRQSAEGAAGNGGGTRASETWGRDEQQPVVRCWGRVAAAAVGGGAAQ
jgi:hypothetical protein